MSNKLSRREMLASMGATAAALLIVGIDGARKKKRRAWTTCLKTTSGISLPSMWT